MLGLESAQFTAWMKRAVAEKRVRKRLKPVTYEWQPTLFDAASDSH